MTKKVIMCGRSVDSLGSMWTLKINKDRHKFSSSHFTIFSKDQAEALHGHNYYVGLEVQGESLSENELLMDLNPLKDQLTLVLKDWDEKILLPKNSPHLKLEPRGDVIDVTYSKRHYRFPTSEVEVLEVKNVTMESLSKLISDSLSPYISPLSYTVFVCESLGQEASFFKASQAKDRNTGHDSSPKKTGSGASF